MKRLSTAIPLHEEPDRGYICHLTKWRPPHRARKFYGTEHIKVVIEAGFNRRLCNRCHTEAKLKNFHVHHKNHNHSDNRVENLEILCPKYHLKEHGFYDDGVIDEAEWELEGVIIED